MNKLICIIFIAMAAVGCGGEIKNVSFSEDVMPIIQEECLDCHNSENARGKLNFETYEKLFSSRYFNRSQSLIIAGDAAQSRLYLVVNSNKPAIRMPPEYNGYDKLAEDEIEIIKVWINEGAKKN